MAMPYMTFGLGEALLALPVAPVQAILDPAPISRIPGAPGHLLGLLDVRGTSTTVIDLRELLGEPPRPDAPDTRFVVLRLEHEGQPVSIALRVDRVIEVAPLDGDRIEPPTPGLHPWDARHVEGVGRRNGAFVTVLRPEGFFGEAAAEVLAAARAAPSADAVA